jgi:hypothetical protein
MRSVLTTAKSGWTGTRDGPRAAAESGLHDALLTEDMLKSPTRQVGIAERVK